MTDKQLTVAELLAKAGKEGASSNQRTRRRRSIEDGGVTVAELTGRIPKVDAKPAEAKHSNQPLDAEPTPPSTVPSTAPETAKTDEADFGAEAGYAAPQSHQATPTPAATPTPEPPTRSATFGGNTAADLEQTTQWSIIDNESPQDFDEPIPTSQPTPAAPAAASDAPVPKPTLKPVMKPAMKPAMADPVAAEPTPEEAEPESPAVTYVVVGEESEAEPDVATTGVTKPVPSSDETIVLSVVSEDDPVRLTTGSFPVVTSEQFFEAPVADLAKNPTVVFQEETPAPSPLDDAVAQAMEQGQADRDEHGFDEPGLDEHELEELELGEPGLDDSGAVTDYPKTEVMPAATVAGAAQHDDYVVDGTEDTEYYDDDFAEPQDGQYDEFYEDDEYAEYPETGYESESTYDEQYLDDGYATEYTDEYVEEYEGDDAVTDARDEADSPAVPSRAAATMIGEEEEPLEKMSMISVIGMAIAGILVGAALFIGFQYLWASMDKKIVAALGLAVTIALVTIVRVMRTSRDGLSMALTGLVGLVMTFGPLIIVGW